MALKVRDSNLKVTEVESKINQIEDIAMGADRAAKQSTRIAETLMDSIQESFTQACLLNAHLRNGALELPSSQSESILKTN